LNKKYTSYAYGHYGELNYYIDKNDDYLEELEQIKNEHPLGLLYEIIYGKLSDS
jgi:hypothetical protein